MTPGSPLGCVPWGSTSDLCHKVSFSGLLGCPSERLSAHPGPSFQPITPRGYIWGKLRGGKSVGSERVCCGGGPWPGAVWEEENMRRVLGVPISRAFIFPLFGLVLCEQMYRSRGFAGCEPDSPGPTFEVVSSPQSTSPGDEEHQRRYSYTRVERLLDVPMIDPAITRGPDGLYYLTGTLGTPERDGSINFSVNDGIRLWKSTDLKSWSELGVVAPLSLVKATVEDLALIRSSCDVDEFKGLISPEIHFIKGDVYLTYSLKPCGTGLLRSKSGKPEGPYQDLGLITKRGRDASLFVDDDGAVYWVFGGGWIARMNETLTALAEPPRLIQPVDGREGLTPGGQILQVGTGGAFLFKKDGTYHLVAAGIHGRLGVPCYDTFVATAKSLEGPWSRRKLAIPHGGQVTMFEGPEGQWYATFSGEDSRALLRERPAIVPVDWVEGVAYWSSKGEPWPWKRPQVITEAWGWEHARPISSLRFRDPIVVNGRDGWFYATGLHLYQSHGRNTCVLKGKDPTGRIPWECIPLAGFRTVDDIPWFKDPGTPGAFLVSIAKIAWARETFWITFTVPGGGRTLRSASGTMDGPWEVAYDPGERAGWMWPRIPLEDYQGRLYGRWHTGLWTMSGDYSSIDRSAPPPPTEPGYKPVFDGRLGGYRWETADGSSFIRGDVPAGNVYKIDGKYLMIGGAGWHGDYRAFGTYDSEVFWAHEIGGPWHPNRMVLPHGGHSGIFEDDRGGWWFISFANDNFLPDMHLLRCLPIEIRWRGNGYFIGPKHRQENPYVHRERQLVPIGPASEARYPLVNLPPHIRLAHPFVVLGPDRLYYLTGTAGTGDDFCNNDGIYIWKSTDLVNWQPMGRVVSLGREPGAIRQDDPFCPLHYFFSPPDSLEPRYDRGIIAPKIYNIAGRWWIVFSLSRQKIGILRSTTGKPEGPYELWGPEIGNRSRGFLADCGWQKEINTDSYYFAFDPSLFFAEDVVYCVFGPGWIAPLTPDLKAFAERPRLLLVEDDLYAGKGGCQIFKRDGLYHLLALNEWGDLIERTSDNLFGPYRNPRLVLSRVESGSVFFDENGSLRLIARKMTAR